MVVRGFSDSQLVFMKVVVWLLVGAMVPGMVLAVFFSHFAAILTNFSSLILDIDAPEGIGHCCAHPWDSG